VIETGVLPPLNAVAFFVFCRTKVKDLTEANKALESTKLQLQKLAYADRERQERARRATALLRGSPPYIGLHYASQAAAPVAKRRSTKAPKKKEVAVMAGARVTRVSVDGPGALSGLREGDIIVKVASHAPCFTPPSLLC
jgi:hypothetical protein